MRQPDSTPTPTETITNGSTLDDHDIFAAVVTSGREAIDDAKRQGRDVSDWEAFWLRLWREYELLTEELEHNV